MSIPHLAKQMVGYTANIPGTSASKKKLRRLILAMVRQLEIETRRGDVESGVSGDDVALGDVPCLFGTLTSQRYHWDGIIRIIAQGLQVTWVLTVGLLPRSFFLSLNSQYVTTQVSTPQRLLDLA